MSDKKLQLGLAGEYRVVSELLRRGFNATVALGNTKATDILVLYEDGRYLRVEVKTSQNGRNFVTGYYPKYTDGDKVHPDIWVLFAPDKDPHLDRFFILKHTDVAEIQLDVNNGTKTKAGEGVDNIPIKLLSEKYLQHENKWELFGKIEPE